MKTRSWSRPCNKNCGPFGTCGRVRGHSGPHASGPLRRYCGAWRPGADCARPAGHKGKHATRASLETQHTFDVRWKLLEVQGVLEKMSPNPLSYRRELDRLRKRIGRARRMLQAALDASFEIVR